jgi:hypothetical protein
MGRTGVERVPALALVTFWFGVLAGLVAFAGLLGVLGSGVAGEYSYTAVVIWAAAGGAMSALFAISIWIGGRELVRRGIDGRFIRRRVALSVAAFLAAVATVPVVAAGFGGSGLPVLGDLLALVFLASLVGCNLQIWRRLRAQLG